MSVTIHLTIDDAALRQALRDPQLIAGPLKDFLAKSAFVVESRAKEVVPVDTGRLRASITSDLKPTSATVKAATFYASHVEFGTRPHWPPLSAMQPWARRHGFGVGIGGARRIAWIISRFGTRPHPFMRPAVRQSTDEIRSFLRDMAVAIERRWRR